MVAEHQQLGKCSLKCTCLSVSLALDFEEKHRQEAQNKKSKNSVEITIWFQVEK